MSSQKGYSTQEKDERLSAQFQTIEPVRELQFGSTVVAHQFVNQIGTDAAEAGSTESVIVATGHAALKGDVIRLTSGALSGREVKVWEVATNSITLAETLPSAVAAAVTFQILRHKYPTVDSAGAVNVNATIVEAAVAADGGALPALTKVVSGYDGTNVQVLRTDVNGELQVDVLSSALPTGAATETTLATLATEATLLTMAGDVSAIYTLTTTIEAGTPDSLGQATMANSMPVVLASNQTAIPVTDNGSSLTVDGTVAATQSGTWDINNISGTVSLPTGAATSAAQTNGTQKTQIVDGSGNVIGSTGNALDVNVKTPITIDVSLSQANDSVAVFGSDGTTNRALKTDANGELQIDVLSSALPTGAATAAAQTDGTQKTKIVDAAGGVVTTTTSGPVKALDVHIAVDATSPGNDVFATQMVGTRYNQIEVNFETAPGATFITQTFSGGGAVSHTNGHALYSTGTAVSAQAKAVSVGTVVYRPANEIYAYFTAAFTAPTSAASHQRIGIYDSTDGFFIGYEGTSFGVTTRSGGSDSSVARASFNGDLLTGAAGSKFTRNGSPEAINLAYSNLFRIRFGWLGSGSILFDVFSPDGVWVNFHTIKQPNSSINPSIQKPDLPITLDVQKSSSDATNLIMATACWAGGTSSSYTKITDALTDNSLAGLTRSVITGVTTGGGGGYVNVKVNPSGALVTNVNGTVAATQSGTWDINNVSGTISLPTGAATETTLSAINTKTPALGQAAMVASSPVVIASNQTTLPVSQVGRSVVGRARNVYSSTNVTTGAYVQLVASLAAAVNEVEIFDSSGETLVIATGGAGSEVDQVYVFPGGNGRIPLAIASGARVSIKAVSANATAGEIAINFYS